MRTVCGHSHVADLDLVGACLTCVSSRNGKGMETLQACYTIQSSQSIFKKVNIMAVVIAPKSVFM